MAAGDMPAPVSAVARELRRAERRWAEQRWGAALVAAVAGAAASAFLWAWVTLATGAMWGAMALAVGAVTGGAVRLAGRGVSRWFGLLAALWALIGCAAGNVAAIAYQAAPALQPPRTGWWLLTHRAALAPILRDSFDWWHLVFYAAAAIEGYWLSFERVRAPKEVRT